MATIPTYPGVYIEEIPSGSITVSGVATSVAAFVGRAKLRDAHLQDPAPVASFGEYERMFGGLDADSPLSFSVRDFFLNGGGQALIVNVPGSGPGGALQQSDLEGDAEDKTGIYALEKANLFNLLCIPPPQSGVDVALNVWEKAADYCKLRRAMLIIDPPAAWIDAREVLKPDSGAMRFSGIAGENAALYFPRLMQKNPLNGDALESFAPCGAVAGVIARTDSERGVWKAPAGTDATLRNAPALSVSLTDRENGDLNAVGVNCLRSQASDGRIVWGARTLANEGDWKYLPVRRLALFIEESLYRGARWAVFEPNDEPLWAQLRMNLGSFMQYLFRQGAFQGGSPREAYFVKCDRETTTADDINRGIVNIVVGFAPLKPAEFVIIRLQQIAGRP